MSLDDDDGDDCMPAADDGGGPEDGFAPLPALRFAVGTALAFVPLVMPLIKPIEELESYVLTRRFHSRSPSPFFLCETLKNQESDERELQMMRKWAER